MIVTVTHFETLNSSQLIQKVGLMVLNIKHSFAVVIAKSALQSLLEIPCGIFCNLRWLST